MLPSWLATYDVLMVSEPWERRPPEPECLASLGASVRGALDEGLTAVTETCTLSELWWTESAYRSAVSTLEKASGSKLGGFFGDSFGAIKLPWLADTLRSRDAWAVLHSPAPNPARVATSDILRARAQAVVGLAAQGLKDECPAAPFACDLTLDEVLDRLRATPGVGLTDPAAALVWASYDWPGTKERLWHAIRESLAGQTDGLTKLSLSATYRFERDAFFPNLAGYLAGMCAVYGQWPAEREISSPEDAVAQMLTRMHSICGGENASLRSQRDHATPICLVANKQDPVVPVELAESWLPARDATPPIYYSYPGHGRMSEAAAEELHGLIKGGKCG